MPIYCAIFKDRELCVSCYCVEDANPGHPCGFQSIQFLGRTLIKETIITFTTDIKSLCSEIKHNNEHNWILIVTLSIVQILSCEIPADLCVVHHPLFQNKNSYSFLISYLESNGISVKHNLQSEKLQIHSMSAYSCTDPDTSEKLMLAGTTPSLFTKIDRTITEIGRRILWQQITESKFHPSVSLGGMINEVRNNPGLTKIIEILKEFRFHGVLKDSGEKDGSLATESEFGTSFLFEKSYTEARSIYSRRNLEETSISGYIQAIRTVEDLKICFECMCLIVKSCKEYQLASIANERCPFRILTRFAEKNNYAIITEIPSMFEKIQSGNNVSLLADRIAYVVKPGIDPYLDMCRQVYEDKLSTCQKALMGVVENNDFNIHLTDGREICLVKKMGQEPVRKLRRSENVEGDKSLTKIFALKNSKKHRIYTNTDLVASNKIIRGILDQIIEIEGRICKSVLFELKKFDETFRSARQMIGEIDALVSCSVVSRDPSFKQPIISESVSVNNVINCLFPEFSRVSYVFEQDTVYVITGANMAGKSCYARNLAHVAVLARIGLFLDCDSAAIPLFDEIYLIESTEDLNNLIRNILERNICLDSDYRTPRRLVIVDELQCDYTLQLRTMKFLRKSRILTLLITHHAYLIEELDKDGFRIHTFENFQMQSGWKRHSSVKRICERHFPEIVDYLERAFDK